MHIRDTIAKRPRDFEDPSYSEFWHSIIEALENFLGEGYRVCGYDPDLQVIAAYRIPDLNLDKQYSFSVPLEVAYRIALRSYADEALSDTADDRRGSVEGSLMDGLDLLDEWLERIAPIDKIEERVNHEDFADEVRERMELGRRTYGDRSFELTFSQLMAEVRMEAVDLAGWPYMAWRKLRLWESEMPDGHDLLPDLRVAIKAMEAIGWHASLVWRRLGQLVDEVADMTRASDDQ